jgi:hypothetical protein
MTLTPALRSDVGHEAPSHKAALTGGVPIFVSGPHYDVFVADEFPGCESVALAPFPIRQVARYTHPILPCASFRSYHPGYLNRNELGFRPIQAMIDLYVAERSV